MGSEEGYRYNGDSFCVTDEMKTEYDRDGYMLIKGLFSKEEISHIETSLSKGKYLDYSYGVDDGSGMKAYMLLWFRAGNDVTGMVSRCEKIVNSCESFLGGEVYHYHTKLMMKPAEYGGKHVWHQDYGYWYQFGFLKPDLMTVFIAVDECTKENGCLQVLKGSHKCGRIEHEDVGGQVGANLDRVEQVKAKCALEHVEMKRGDALFFDSNLLHCSSANLSKSRRWAFLCAYCKADNRPLTYHMPSLYSPLQKVPNSAILECTDVTSLGDKHFYDPNVDKLDRLKLTLNPSLPQTK